MKTLGILVSCASILGLTAVIGCDSDPVDANPSTSSSSTTGGEAGMGGTGGTGGAAGSGGMGGGMAAKKANVRVAHLAPDAPAVDFCLQPEGGAWVGPVLESVGATAGLPYPNVTKYLELDETTYTVRLIDPKDTDCTKSLAGLPDIPGIKVTGGEFYTLAAIGELAAAATNKFQVKAYVDDGIPTDGKIKVRFVHTSPDAPNVDVGLGKGAGFTKLWANVPYPMVGLVAGKEYVETDPIVGGAISVRVANMSADVLTIEPVDVPAKSIVTAWAIGKLSGNPAPLKALVCVDTATAGVLTTCSVAP